MLLVLSPLSLDLQDYVVDDTSINLVQASKIGFRNPFYSPSFVAIDVHSSS